jgi:hypothetical protein
MDLLFCLEKYCTAINMLSFLFWHCPSSRFRTKESVIATFFQFYQKETVVLFCFNLLKNCRQHKTELALYINSECTVFLYIKFYMYSLKAWNNPFQRTKQSCRLKNATSFQLSETPTCHFTGTAAKVSS